MNDTPTGNPEVSVVIPAYNRQECIARAVHSALAQTCRNLEVIVVDDGSTDGTLAAVGQIADSRIVILRGAENAGAAAARNRGIEAARGKFVAFLDSDDCWDRDKLQRQLDCLAAAPAGVQVVCSSFRALHAASGRLVERRLEGDNWARRMLDVCAVAPGTTLLARRAVFAEIGLQDTGLRQFEDWDWLLRYQEKYPLLVMPEVLATVRMHGSPAPATVQQQAARLYERRRQSVARQFGRQGMRRFHASMQLEYAVACARSGRPLAAAAAVLRAAAISPGRVFDLLRRTGTKLLRRDY